MRAVPFSGDLSGLRSGGTYLLWLHLPAARRITVGRLGAFDFAAGFYGYVGSAMGPGGLAARLGRHLQGSSRRRWHIDYLRCAADPVAAWVCVSPQVQEHDWAAALAAMEGAWLPAPRFGASDCRCPAHLVGHADPPSPETFLEALKKSGTGRLPPLVVLVAGAGKPYFPHR